LRHIAAMTGGKVEGDRVAKPAHGKMNLGAQPAAGPAKGLILSPFFAPEACW
jgi:hypothetical protein